MQNSQTAAIESGTEHDSSANKRASTDHILTTPDTPAHTPLPWATGKGIAFACSIYSGTTNLAFARQDHGRIDATTAEANAAFIVRACNSHYQLVSALRGLLDEIAKSPCADSILDSAAAGHAFAALSQAGGASE